VFTKNGTWNPLCILIVALISSPELTRNPGFIARFICLSTSWPSHNKRKCIANLRLIKLPPLIINVTH